MISLDRAAGLLAAIGGAVAAIYSGFAFVDSRYVKTPELAQTRDEVKLTSLRLEEKILVDRVAAIQQRIWKIEDRYGADLFEAPGPVKDEHRQMTTDMDDIRQQIKVVMDGYRRGGYEATDSYYKYERPLR